MIKAVDVNEVREYSLTRDTDEVKTVFMLGVLDAPLRARLSDKLTQFAVNPTAGSEGSADIKLNQKVMNIEVVRFGLRGWQNFKDKDGNDVEFDTVSIAVPGLVNRKGMSDMLVSRLTQDDIDELAKEIIGNNRLMGQDRKN